MTRPFPRLAGLALFVVALVLLIWGVRTGYFDPAPSRQTATNAPSASNIPTATPAPTAKALNFILPLPSGWESIPGKLSSTYRSTRPGAGFFQLSMHPPLEGKVDGARAEKELDSLLSEMKSDMPFGRRLEIGHLPARSGFLAYARYQSDEHGTIGFWLLPAANMVFATYVDGGSSASPADLREAQEALQAAEFK
jgi:hypothetical protein